ncbi:hypothetical protein Tco_1276270 [Tanacetum coccineum]
MMTQKLGNGFEFMKKACSVCGSFNHLIKDYDLHDNKLVEKSVLNNKGRVVSQREIRPVWNNAQRVNHQNKLTHPHPKRNFVPTSVATKSGQVPVNAAKQSSPRAAASISTAKPVNTAAPKTKVNDALPITYSYFKAYSPIIKRLMVDLLHLEEVLKENRVLVTKLHNKTPYELLHGSGPDWLFDIDLLTNSMNYKPVTVGNQTNRNLGIKDNVDAVNAQQYILLPLLPDRLQSLENTAVDNAGKKITKEPANEGKRNGQDKEGGVQIKKKEGYANSTNRDSIVSPSVSAAGQSFVNNDDLLTDPLMPDLEDTTDLPTGIFSGAYDDEDVGAEADLNNLDSTMNVSPIPITRTHKDHPKNQIIRDINSATQTRRMTKISKEHALVNYINKQRRTNHKDYQNYLFACFLSQIEPKKVIQALTDPSWVEAMQEELL